ncbi:MAG TPA: hypothetical protein VNH17_15935 [Streptosporangiaceae bacterium]|nr:hypothetical protein [Streptosporangiaceae bacterium]
MQNRTSEFDDIVRTTHISACQIDHIRGGKVVEQFEVTTGPGVTADRMGAALRTIEFESPDFTSPVTVFGSRIQMWGGVVKPATGLHEQVNNAVNGWPGWTLVGLKVDGANALVIGP